MQTDVSGLLDQIRLVATVCFCCTRARPDSKFNWKYWVEETSEQNVNLRLEISFPYMAPYWLPVITEVMPTHKPQQTLLRNWKRSDAEGSDEIGRSRGLDNHSQEGLYSDACKEMIKAHTGSL